VERLYGMRMGEAVTLNRLGRAEVDSITKELIGIHEAGSMAMVRKQDLSAEEEKRIIGSIMFLKEKHMPNGDFDKLKARLVAGGGHMQNRSEYTSKDTSSA
jgi:hypothetical protein